MADKIQVKRGLKANLPTLSVGEPAYCTDTKEFFVGTANGNVLINDLSQLTGKVDKVAGKGLSTNDYDSVEKAEVAKVKDKADKTYVDGQLAGKATQSALNTTNTNVALKADKSYVDTQIGNIGNASPKGTYATLTALQTAFPTGTTGIYIVTADGKWYYWNGSAWTAGGTYQATGLANKSLKLSNLSDSMMNQLFEKKTINPNLDIGAFLDTLVYDYSIKNNMSSVLIPVSEGDSITFTKPTGISWKLYTFSSTTISSNTLIKIYSYAESLAFTTYVVDDPNVKGVVIKLKTDDGTNFLDAQVLDLESKVSIVNYTSLQGAITTVSDSIENKKIKDLALFHNYALNHIDQNYFEQGSIVSTDGTNAATNSTWQTKRIRSNAFIPSDITFIACDPEFELIVYEYNSSGVFLNAYFYAKEFALSTSKLYKVTLQKTDQSIIDVSSYDKVGFFKESEKNKFIGKIEWELGTLVQETGVNYPSTTTIRTINRFAPNSSFVVKVGNNKTARVAIYKDGVFVSRSLPFTEQFVSYVEGQSYRFVIHDSTTIAEASNLSIEPSEIAASAEATVKTLKILSFNVCEYNKSSTGGHPNNANLNTDLISFRRFFGGINADIVATQEDRNYFDAGNTIAISTGLYNNSYPYQHISTYFNYSTNNVYSKYPINSSETKNYITQASGDLARRYTKARIQISDKELVFISTHLTTVDATTRASQMNELLTEVQNEDYFVICGDFNAESGQEFIDKFGSYKMANAGFFGEYKTTYLTSLLPRDNIITNLVMENAEMPYVEISDHLPLTADLRF